MILPMFSMVILTVIVGSIALRSRIKAVKSGLVRARSFKLMKESDFPESVTKSTRNFNNQFEFPVLFYVVCSLFVALNIDSVTSQAFAWAFVLFRVAHAYVHLTYNHLLHRMILFWCSCVCVVVLWLMLVIASESVSF